MQVRSAGLSHQKWDNLISSEGPLMLLDSNGIVFSPILVLEPVLEPVLKPVLVLVGTVTSVFSLQ
jgi:hypothetical protein